jgi:hypothetical protein
VAGSNPTQIFGDYRPERKNVPHLEFRLTSERQGAKRRFACPTG